MSNGSAKKRNPIDFNSLSNRYYAMRHGHSLANEAGIIVSDPAHGVNGYGLSELGRKQVEQSIKATCSLIEADAAHPLIIISSDFKRALETAQIVHQGFDLARSVVVDERLRERYFGLFEGQPDSAYTSAWDDDLLGCEESSHDVESLHSVTDRATSLIADLEKTYTAHPLLLVAHGDILQILQCAFMQQESSQHRSLRHLENAEVRLLNQD